MGADTAVSEREVSVEGCCDVGLFSYSFSSAGEVDLDDPYFFDSWTVRRKCFQKQRTCMNECLHASIFGCLRKD